MPVDPPVNPLEHVLLACPSKGLLVPPHGFCTVLYECLGSLDLGVYQRCEVRGIGVECLAMRYGRREVVETMTMAFDILKKPLVVGGRMMETSTSG